MCPAPPDAAKVWSTPSLATSCLAPSWNTQGGECCYGTPVYMSCGRPFTVEETPVFASKREGHDRSWIEPSQSLPSTDGLTKEERSRLATLWTDMGMFEHASIASFGRFALELMAVGAPCDLVERAHLAALDEARHTRLCLTLASAYAGREIAPSAFPFRGSVAVDGDLAAVAARVALEGCIGETVAAIEAAERAAHAEDPAVRAALESIAKDEAEHAELAWRVVAWAMRLGGAPVQRAVAAVFDELDEQPNMADVALRPSTMLAHGHIDSNFSAMIHARAVADVVLPSSRALFQSLAYA